MASALSESPVISPIPSANEADGVGAVSRRSIARQIVEDHVRQLRARRSAELIWEKLLLHVDGSGDAQWCDIFNDTRVEIPRFVSEFRKSENLLRLVAQNAVAHHTTLPLRFMADSLPDRRSQERALMDTLWINHLAGEQDFNTLFAEALTLAMPCGFGVVHGYWRDDVPTDFYEPIAYGDGGYEEEEQLGMPAPGMIDCFPGNPFDHVFNSGARRGSYRWSSYGRLVNAQAVRDAFAHIPEARGLEGSTRIPSAAEFQRVARSWRFAGMGLHGSPVMNQTGGEGEELLTILCRETAPAGRGDPGRLQIVGVPGTVDLRMGRGNAGHAVLLADQPLPGGDYSFSIFYSDHRGTDIHGKAWIEGIDQSQVDLNIAKSKRWEAINKMLEAPIVAPGGAIGDDMTELGTYALLEIEPSLASWRPQVMEWPMSVLQALDKEIAELRQAIYTGGGYQAVSRGEAPGSRMAYRAILALQQADNTVHGPVNVRFQKSANDFARRCWKQMKQYGDVPWEVVAGDEYAHLIDGYIDRTRLSEHPPRFKLVNAFGSSPEMRAQEVLELMTTQGADGQPFLTTEEARRQYPNQMVFDSSGNPAAVQRRRARTVASRIHQLVAAYREETGFDESQLPVQWQYQAIQHVGYQIAYGFTDESGQIVRPGLEQLFPRRRDDDPQATLAALTEITQDEQADLIAREAAQFRQQPYYEMLAMMQGGPPQEGAPGGDRPRQPGSMSRTAVAADMGGGPGQTLNQSGEEMGPSPIAATAR
jgi:hypothetical protein